MEKIDAKEFKPRILRSGKVLESVEWKKPQRKKRKTNKLAEPESTSAGAPSDIATSLPNKTKPPKEEPRDDGWPEFITPRDEATGIKVSGKRGAPKKSTVSVDLAEGFEAANGRTLRIKVERVDPEAEGAAFAQKDTVELNSDQKLPAAIVRDGRKSNNMQISKDPDTLPAHQPETIKQKRKNEDDEPSCSIKHDHPGPGQVRVLRNTALPIDHTQKSNEKKLPLKRGRKPKKYTQPVTSETTASAASIIADTIEILRTNTETSKPNANSAVAMETEQQKDLVPPSSSLDTKQIFTGSVSYIDGVCENSDAVEETVSMRAEKVMVSIPISSNILLAVKIKQKTFDEGHKPITRQERVSKTTISTAECTQESNDKKVPLKRGRKSKKCNLPVTSETVTAKEKNKSATATMADKIEILYLNNETSQAAGGRAQQQPIYVSDTEELLEISDVAEIPPQDNHFVLENSGVFLNTNQPDHSCYLQLRKPFQRLLVREWFYSNIDQCLLGRGSGVQDMETLLSSQLPALVTRRLNRAAWNHIRDILRKLTLVQPRRRCSEKFFLDERMHLEQRREKVRFLQLHPMFEYLDDDLPADLPVGIESGDSVVAQLNEPYGVFRGVVEEVGGSYAHAYTVRFEDPEIDGQIVPDFQIASATPSSEPAPIVEEDAIVMIPQNLSKQLELFRDQLDEKEKLLNEMECLRLRFKSIRDRPETHQAQSMMRGQQRRYLNCIENLQTMNTSIGLHMRTITRLVDNVDDALVDTQVVQIAQHLQDICCKAGNLPLRKGVLELTLRQLRGPPSRLNELQRYLQSHKFEQ